MLHEHNLHDYQKRAVEHVIEHPKCGLFLEMGLGKTISSLTAVKKILYELIECNKTLIVAPKRVAENVWTSELDKWSHLSNMSASIIMGPPKQREAALRVEADVYLISRDNFAWLVTHFGGSYLPFDMLIIDESSSFKSHKSVRFKALRQVQHNFKRAVLLTGTPAPQSLIDLWPQLYILDRGERLGKTMTAFRSEFFRPGMTNGHVVYNYRPLKGSQERIFDRIKDICMSMKARDYLDMPEAQIIPVPIKMDPATQDQYNRFEEEQVLEMLESMEEGQAISAANAAGLNNKLLQFANGAVYDEDKVWHEVHTLKLDAIEELIEAANGQPVLIAWTYRSDRDRLLERLKKYKPRELKDGQDIDDWNAGKIKVLMMHPASGGHGLNLQDGGHIIIWFGNTWALELYQQFNARLDRQGQKYQVLIYKLIVEDTWDTRVVKSQHTKAATQDTLMEAVKARVKKYLKK